MFFFIAITGNRFDTTNVSMTMKSTGKILGIDEKKLKPQLLRKTTSTAVIERKIDGELKDVTL